MIAEKPKPLLKELLDNVPDPSRGSLTPKQLRKLQHANWGEDGCPVRFNTRLSPNELNSSIFFRNTRLFLQKLLDFRNKTTATDRGNLSRAFVKLMFEEMKLDETEKAFIKQYNKVLNETDVFPLHIIKTASELAGLISKRSKKLLVTSRYQHLLSDEKAGELYFLLFRAYFRKFNLAYCDRFPKLENIQGTFDYSLYRISRLCNEYQTLEELFDEIFLPKVREEIRQTRSTIREISWLVEARIMRHLVKFGLLEAVAKEEKYFSRMEKVRKSWLFDKFIGYEL